MKKLFIDSTYCTPAVLFLLETGVLTITGKSYTENVVEFYGEIEKHLDEFINNQPNKSLMITCELEYINTSASKLLLNILKKAINNIDNVIIVWGYEEDDEDMLEQGEIYEESLEVPFEYRVFVLPKTY